MKDMPRGATILVFNPVKFKIGEEYLNQKRIKTRRVIDAVVSIFLLFCCLSFQYIYPQYME